MHDNTVHHWSAIRRVSTEVLNLTGSHRGAGRVQISTLCVHRGLLLAGGFNGELVARRLASPGLAYASRITHDENAITNAIEVYGGGGGGCGWEGVGASGVRGDDGGGSTSACCVGPLRIMASNNDCAVRTFDATSFALLSRFTFPWAVNFTTVSPGGQLLCVAGDDPAVLLCDAASGKTVTTLKGHHDFSFGASWHPVSE